MADITDETLAPAPLPVTSPWERVTPFGRPRKFPKPEDLWAAAIEYFEYVRDNPLYERKAFANGFVADLPKMRAMTLGGLSTHMGIGLRTWHDYAERDDFSHVTALITQIISTQKFEGAAADLLNANIIARDLGLADKSESLVDANGGLAAVLARIGATK